MCCHRESATLSALTLDETMAAPPSRGHGFKDYMLVAAAVAVRTAIKVPMLAKHCGTKLLCQPGSNNGDPFEGDPLRRLGRLSA